MPRTIQRPGLSEALRDFGVDSSPQVATLGDFSIPTIQIQDLSANYEPAVRARILATVDDPAVGGSFGGFTLSALSGFWLNRLWVWGVTVTSTTTEFFLQVSNVDWSALGVPVGTVSWNAVGSKYGETALGTGTGLDFFSRAHRATNAATGLSNQSIIIDPRRGLDHPLWVPGGSFCNVVTQGTGAPVVVCFDAQIPATSGARFG